MKVSDSQLARDFDLSYSYFPVMRNVNKEKYEMIFSFDKNRRYSIKKYIEYVSNKIIMMEQVLYSFEKHKSDYGRLVRGLGMSKTTNLAVIYDAECSRVFRIASPRDYLTININTLRRWEAVIESQRKVA